MPEIGEIDGFRVFFYSNEGAVEGLPRVFVSKNAGEAEFLISQDEAPIILLKRSHGFDGEELEQVRAQITSMAEELRNAWNSLFC